MTQKEDKMPEVSLNEIDRIVYIWARYSGERCKGGKKYYAPELKELIRRLERYRLDQNSFCEGFEKNEFDTK